MYVLVQGAVPKYNSAQCLLFYISCLIQLIVIFLFTKIFLLLMSMFMTHQNVNPFVFKQFPDYTL